MAITFTTEVINQLRSTGGDIYEFGVYRGKSLREIVDLFNNHSLPSGRVFGFDSFEGLPAEADGVTPHPEWTQGHFHAGKGVGEGSIDNLPSKLQDELIAAYGKNKCQLIVGFYDRLSPFDIYICEMSTASFIHIDCDLYISAYQALDFMFGNALVKSGTVIRFDDMKEINDEQGEKKAWREITEKYNVDGEKLRSEHDEVTVVIRNYKT